MCLTFYMIGGLPLDGGGEGSLYPPRLDSPALLYSLHLSWWKEEEVRKKVLEEVQYWHQLSED